MNEAETRAENINPCLKTYCRDVLKAIQDGLTQYLREKTA